MLGAFSLLAAARPPSDQDGVNDLLSMSDFVTRQDVGSTFSAQMQNTPLVQGVFFPNPTRPAVPLPPTAADWAGEVAAALVSLAIARTSGHGFNGTVNDNGAQGFLDGNLAPGNQTFLAIATSNYSALFPSTCKSDAHAFQDYLGGSLGPADRWGTLLADTMCSQTYINSEFIKLNPAVDPGGWYQIFYANLYKVQRLNAAEVARVQSAWAPYLKGKQDPSTNDWTFYAYMQSASYTYETFFSQVMAAISVSTSHTETLGCRGGAAASCTTMTTTTYGPAVNDWLGGHAGLGGFIVGRTSLNEESHSNSSGGCCFVAGTPIRLADGSRVPIEAVAAGTPVVCRDGTVHNRDTQDVVWSIEAHELLFGINDIPPFFNASHPFMTLGGWKSMSPRASRLINPDLEIGQLAVGDVLLRAVDGEQLRYEEVTVEQITKVLAGDVGVSEVHSLLISPPNPGYHAHGFLVAVNYPKLREDQFVGAFSGLSAEERRFMLKQITPLLPALRRGLGNYVGEILRRALGGAEDTRPIGAPVSSVIHRD